MCLHVAVLRYLDIAGHILIIDCIADNLQHIDFSPYTAIIVVNRCRHGESLGTGEGALISQQGRLPILIIELHNNLKHKHIIINNNPNNILHIIPIRPDKSSPAMKQGQQDPIPKLRDLADLPENISDTCIPIAAQNVG